MMENEVGDTCSTHFNNYRLYKIWQIQAGRCCKFVLETCDRDINPLNPSGNYVPPVSTVSYCAFCICGFLIIVVVNSDYFLKQR
jgi:hypothetical protein